MWIQRVSGDTEGDAEADVEESVCAREVPAISAPTMIMSYEDLVRARPIMKRRRSISPARWPLRPGRIVSVLRGGYNTLS